MKEKTERKAVKELKHYLAILIPSWWLEGETIQAVAEQIAKRVQEPCQCRRRHGE